MATMRSQSFKDLLSASGPDNLRSRAPTHDRRPVGVPAPATAEVLEHRRMFSISANIVSNTLVVTGDSGVNTIWVYQLNRLPNDVVEVDDQEDAGNIYSFAVNLFTGIKVSAGGGNDEIRVGRTGSLLNGDEPVGYAVQGYGEAGDDSIFGGNNNDPLYGGGGYDSIEGFNGNDNLNGGDEGDTLNGGNGADVAYGGAGDDVLNGGDGNDTLAGEGDNDSLDGGNNDDNMSGGAGNDVLTGGAGQDTLNGDGGDDLFHASDGELDYIDGGDGTDCIGDADWELDVISNIE
jgi:Ca2+-binding RTX toxin-like protein